MHYTYWPCCNFKVLSVGSKTQGLCHFLCGFCMDSGLKVVSKFARDFQSGSATCCCVCVCGYNLCPKFSASRFTRWPVLPECYCIVFPVFTPGSWIRQSILPKTWTRTNNNIMVSFSVAQTQQTQGSCLQPLAKTVVVVPQCETRMVCCPTTTTQQTWTQRERNNTKHKETNTEHTCMSEIHENKPLPANSANGFNSTINTFKWEYGSCSVVSVVVDCFASVVSVCVVVCGVAVSASPSFLRHNTKSTT